ncbi:hypothetical protein GCM10023238_07230 [Streptomyces heliomycini]
MIDGSARLDHPDGLADPDGYLQAASARGHGRPVTVWMKILADVSRCPPPAGRRHHRYDACGTWRLFTDSGGVR